MSDGLDILLSVVAVVARLALVRFLLGRAPPRHDSSRSTEKEVKHQMNSYLSVSRASMMALVALAAAADARADSPSTTATANINLVSQYRFRGIDQTWGKPAVQGGADLSLANGVYAGVWASNVSGNSYPGGSLELDYYAGYNGKINDDFSWTAGGYGY